MFFTTGLFFIFNFQPVYRISCEWNSPDEEEITKTLIQENHSDIIADRDIECINLLQEYEKYKEKEEALVRKYKYIFHDFNKVSISSKLQA